MYIFLKKYISTYFCIFLSNISVQAEAWLVALTRSSILPHSVFMYGWNSSPLFTWLNRTVIGFIPIIILFFQSNKTRLKTKNVSNSNRRMIENATNLNNRLNVIFCLNLFSFRNLLRLRIFSKHWFCDCIVFFLL